MKQDDVVPTLQGNLPPSAKPLVEAWIDKFSAFGTDASFWRCDAGETFSFICSQSKTYLQTTGIAATNDDVFAMFQIIVLNFVYGLHRHPPSKSFIQQSLGKGFFAGCLVNFYAGA